VETAEAAQKHSGSVFGVRLRAIESADVVSLDIFDTLLLRLQASTATSFRRRQEDPANIEKGVLAC
jgi:hypothetical protein